MTRNSSFSDWSKFSVNPRGYAGDPEKAEYLGWRPTVEGKHIESAYFAYFCRELGCKTILCMRKMKGSQIYKPYAIIDQYTFDVGVSELQKETPL